MLILVLFGCSVAGCLFVYKFLWILVGNVNVVGSGEEGFDERVVVFFRVVEGFIRVDVGLVFGYWGVVVWR